MKPLSFLFRFGLIVFLAFSVLAVLPSPQSVSADPNIRTVCSSGCDYTTIQAAVNAASDGDVILVSPGTYTENITINKNVKLLSTNGRDSTTIEGISGVGAVGTITITGNTTALQIGDIDQGFKIIGIDNGNPAVENASIYFQGNHSNAIVKGNEIVANGDLGLITEWGATVSGFVIEGNIFSGKTFVGSNPAGEGFGQQFSLPNVPRQLVAIGGGATGTGTTNITFRNNIVNGIAGGFNSFGQPQGNTLVTIDAENSVIEGNRFEGVTSRFATSLRARRPNTTIENNIFSSTGLLTSATGHIFLQNNPINADLIESNTFDKGVYVENTLGGTVGISISAAVTATPAAYAIHVLPGIYTEQVVIEKDLTLLGSGDNTIIRSPATLTSTYTIGSNIYKPVILVKNASNVILQDLVVDGDGKGNANNRFIGVGYFNSGGLISNVEIKNVQDTPFSGAQHGVALYVYNGDGQERQVEVKDSKLVDFQKNGTVFFGSNLTVNFHDNEVIGKGPTPITAQNGVQFSGGASGEVKGNTVTGIAYTGATWTASGILLYEVGNVTVEDNELNNCQTSIYLYGGSSVITNNIITTSKAGIGGGSYLTGIAAADPPFLPPSPVETITSFGQSGARNATNDVSIMDSGDVVVIQNNIVNGGGDDPTSVGIGAWAGYTDEDVSFSITDNYVSGWGYGLDISKCVSRCRDGEFASITLKENKIHQNIVGMYTNVEVDASLNWWGTLSWYGYSNVTGIKDLFEIDGDGDVDWQPWRNETLTLSLDIPTITYTDDDNAGKTEGLAGANGGTFGYDAFATIEDALNHVAPGGTVYVGAGNYSGDIQINKAVTL
ncbi:MAG: hypothetical protein ACOYXO_06710, partial [Chloroflexota bacterium]